MITPLFLAALLLPLAAFALLAVLPRLTKVPAAVIALASGALALAASLAAVASYSGGQSGPLLLEWTWVAPEFFSFVPRFAPAGVAPALALGFLADPLNLLMLCVVTGIGFMVLVFSVFYMNEDGDFRRYFSFLNFFLFTMTGLVISSNLLQTFMFWELVGLASYLLIGFWFEKNSASDAGRKAFVLNRLADLGFVLGVILLFLFLGTLRITDLNAALIGGAVPAALVTALVLLVFLGVMGKSAQFPFHVWLPDAMEGPTPVSALIHSATMVAAGVFLLVRMSGFFSASPAALTVILAVGCFTALLAATLATVQNDIKRVLAYSTVSQLGLMVAGAGAGAFGFAFYHLVTHAFFKSMLFLAAGAWIHAHSSNDLYAIARGGGRKNLVVFGTFLIGIGSLAGLPPFGGFFSKDAVLHAIWVSSPFFGAAGLLVTLLTAYYSFRMVFVLARAKPAADHAHPGAHAHRPTPLMAFLSNTPLIILAVASFAAGLGGLSGFGAHLLHAIDPAAHAVEIHIDFAAWAVSAAAVGIALAWLKFGRGELRDPVPGKGPLAVALDRKWFVDDAYDFLVKRVGLGVAKLLHDFDLLVPNKLMVDDTAKLIGLSGGVFSRIQNGSLQNYLGIALAAFGAAAALLAWTTGILQ